MVARDNGCGIITLVASYITRHLYFISCTYQMGNKAYDIVLLEV